MLKLVKKKTSNPAPIKKENGSNCFDSILLVFRDY